MRSIKVLPESVRGSMRSGVILFDLTRVVEELVFNSLDAGATKVIVAVGIGTSYIKVTDNGCGISRDGLVLLGERYATSKFEQLASINTVPESFGFRGEALSSISDFSLLEVFTKAHGMPNGYRKVIKGCKSLYLGIDDDRQDVGTTVVVRDLFYNQPVKRRHLQSSPKKVLQSVKECILNIALVHLATCFKLVDVESGDELLSLYPSSSPLPLLTSGFGIEGSHSLHKLDESEGKLKLSGYISGPYETFSVKAFQYFYINSRCISRGPIHKLLSQLAAMHECSDLLKADIRSQCGKRSRVQTSPTYILNLACPRAHYDLSFEPAKTCVEFKDWDPVFDFIKKAVSRIWSEDILSNDRLPKKRCLTKCNQDSIILSSPQLEMPRDEPKHMPLSGYSSNRSLKKAVRFEDYGYATSEDIYLENKKQTDLFPKKWCLRKCNQDSIILSSPQSEMPRKKAVEFEDNGYGTSEDIYLDNKEHMDLHPKKGCLKKCNQDSIILSSPQLEMPRKKDVRFEDYGHVTSDDIYLKNKEHMDLLSDAKWHPNSLLTGWSTSNGFLVKQASPVSFHFDDDLMNPFLRSCSSRDTLPIVKSTRGDDKLRFQADKFKKWLCMDDYRVDNEEETDYIKQSSEPWLDDAVTIWSPPRITRPKGSFDTLLTGGDCLTEDNSHWTSPVSSIQYSKSSRQSFKDDWSIFSEKVHVEPSTAIVTKRCFEHGRNDGFDLFAHEEEEKDIFNLDYMRYSSSWDDCKKNISNSQNDSILSPKQYDFLYESDWARSPVAASHHKPSLSYVERERKTIAHCRIHDKQRRRSCSAPPFYREKEKIIALNSWMNNKSENSYHGTHHDAPTLQEASHLKNTQKSSANDKKVVDKAEISDYEVKVARCLDVYNTDSDLTLKENQGLEFGVKWRNGCPLTTSIQNTPNDVSNQEKILDISSGILHLSGDSLLPKSTSKKCLEDCRVLYQVDKKFIPIVGGGILAIIDQHAADERIRLEDLREKVLSAETKTNTYLDAEQELVLPEIGYQLLSNYSEQIQKWGWICNFHAQSSVSFKKNLNFLNNQPSAATLIAVPCILGVNLTDVDLLEFLQQLSDTDGSSVIPPAVLRVLNFKACRGAIMFGDALLPSECSLIVEELKKTSMCFQCAHGRPTTAPLVNLVALHNQISKLGNWSDGSSGSWHGLSRHKPSLERAAHRLSQC
ncbi:DNA mismatch repair protein MLH3-like [Bidens hawaiensis]|uniref:DNA mismatch repair protein MLH3-like n=1 Tax=Bidens hawaiensis TaxID=980011 RepID=UPI0040490AA2